MRPEPDPDAELCRRAAAGDDGAFRILVAAHEKKLRSFLGHVAGRDLADELAQEAFVKAWRSLHAYRGESAFPSWLCAIGWRCFLDHVRRERSEGRKRVSAAAEEAPPNEAAPGARLDLAKALARLEPIERAALVLCHGEGWSHGEAARTLKLPLGTLKGTVRRAKDKCRTFLEGAEHG